MAGLNAAFERVAKAAEKRLEASAKKQERRLEAAGKKALTEVGAALRSALDQIVKNADRIADELRIESAQARSDFRRTVETVNGLTDGARKGATFGAVLGPKGAAIGAVVGGFTGGVAGASIEDARKEALRFRHEIERERAGLNRLLADIDREGERLRSARRRTGRVG